MRRLKDRPSVVRIRLLTFSYLFLPLNHSLSGKGDTAAPFGEHVPQGGNKALPKKRDIVFQATQMGRQGACVLAYPQGGGAGL